MEYYSTYVMMRRDLGLYHCFVSRKSFRALFRETAVLFTSIFAFFGLFTIITSE
jgi:hypothetical protein